ncbi:MAG TPA: carboxypeptidase-like regulatory domain-containing protein [Terriglobales bacterium]|nr:carboxypeptidase-like regulatory domain-containing protein [Terriglobales bacterium]
MRSRRRLLLLVLAAALGALAGAAGKDKPNATVKITVLKDENGKPVANAHVVLHPVDKKGQQERGGVELKTNQDGECSYTGVPYGRLRVQVIAHGRQTFGEDYEINQPEHDVVIKLKLPQDQLTIYK